MAIQLYFIRHGMTQGNSEGRYIGRTDEPLCPEGRRNLQKKVYPKVEKVYASPRLRCLETAGILYPQDEPVIVEEVAECDFGLFEGKTAEELQEMKAFRDWVESEGKLPFPEGESRESFSARCLEGVRKIWEDVKKNHIKTAAVVVHGGVIMCVLSELGRPKQPFYHYHVENGEGYRLKLEGDLEDGGVWEKL